VPEPERLTYLARTSFRPAPDAPAGLSAQLFRTTAVTAHAVTTAARKSSSGGDDTRFGVVSFGSVFDRKKVSPEKYIYHNIAALPRSGGLQGALSIIDVSSSYGLCSIEQIISYLRVAVEYIADVPMSYL
jgi:hypothetical protein